MTQIGFGRLSELKPREAWRNEAGDFTPWLAANMDRLSEAVGIPLELEGTEVAVESFAADILARNPMDGGMVLIENQLEQTDHTHLGQIMTYLAGLNAQTVIWIAPAFREAHLSAVRWLNQHTAESFSFFAVRIRLLRIGDSPYAPVFEVIEKPNDWDRTVSAARREGQGKADPRSDFRQDFWEFYLSRYPSAAQGGVKVQKGWNGYSALHNGDIQVSVWIGERDAGIYVRGGWGERKHEAARILSPVLDRLVTTLGCDSYDLGNAHGHVFGQRLKKTYLDRSNWPEIVDWMEERRLAYVAAISAALDH